jgi:signal transduction histidine kinase
VAGRDLRTLLVEYAHDFADASGLSVHVDWPDAEPADRLSPEAEVQVFRIIQEALANVRRHAGARQVSVEVSVDRAQILIAVRDDGRGFDPDARPAVGQSRFGLRTMAERAETLGGTLEVESAPQSGTLVRLRVPLLSPEQRVR